MIKKIFVSIAVGIISIIAVIAITKAFTGPGSQPPTGNPAFWTKSVNDVYYNVSGGNVGIGTIGPAYKLDVQNGQINSSGGLCMSGVCKTDWNQIQGTSYWTQSGSTLYASSTSWNVGVGTASVDSNYKITTSGGGIKAVANLAGQPAGYFDNSSGYALITGTGNVGIGTTNPVAPLTVQGGTITKGTIQLNNDVTTGIPNAIKFLQTDNVPRSDLKKGCVSMGIATGGSTYGGNFYIATQGINSGSTGTPSCDVSQDGIVGNVAISINPSTGNVGIGVTDPLSRLALPNNASIGWKTSGSSGAEITGISATDAKLNLTVNGAPRLMIDLAGNVGIGTTNPQTKLEIADPGAIRLADGRQLEWGAISGSTMIYGYSGGSLHLVTGGGNKLTILSNGNVGIGTASPGSKLSIAGGNLDLGNNNITGVNKLTVNSIDPIFKINGKNYATYVSDFAGGLRVETSGVLKLDSSYEINFNNLNEGSDLWLFWQTSSKNINDLSVILTPGFDGKVWYEKRDNKIIIHTEKSGEISYRLSAPRIDNRNEGNLAEDQSIKGIDVLDYQR